MSRRDPLERPWSSELLSMIRPGTGEHDARPFRAARGALIGEVGAPAPGWWVCPTCGRRVDRADETRTITGRVCTGPTGAARHRRHAPAEMTVQR